MMLLIFTLSASSTLKSALLREMNEEGTTVSSKEDALKGMGAGEGAERVKEEGKGITRVG